MHLRTFARALLSPCNYGVILWGSDIPRILASFINYLVLLDSKHHIETVHMVSGHSLTRDFSLICSLH